MNLELWRTNSKIPDNLVDSHVSEIKKSVLPFRNMWSTFELLGTKKSPDLIFAEYYESILDVVVSDFGIKSRVDKLSFNYWTQVYGNKARHSEHDHLSGATLFSWVHFIRPTKEKCFCFLDDERRPYFPEQNSGDFIVFPEWALHTVKPNTSGEERVVIAGNVNYGMMNRPDGENTVICKITKCLNDTLVIQQESIGNAKHWKKQIQWDNPLN